MLKSVFSKYLLAFLLIITISFFVLAGVICSMVTSYSGDAKRGAVEDGAQAVSDFLAGSYHESYSGSFSQYVYLNRDVLRGSLELLSVNEEQMMVLVTDETGAILLTDVGNERYVSMQVEPSLLEAVIAAGNTPTTRLSDLTLLDTQNLVGALPLFDSAAAGEESGDVIGAVFVCSSSGSITGLVETMLKTILISCMWVMIAAMLAVYFISEKISSPLKEMSRAAKQYAAGKFDVRVPVKGSDEVAELAMAFNNMANSLATVEDQRRSFLANVSHDLRTPMTTIAGFIDGILDGAIPPEKQPYYLELIAGEVRRLSRLVASLLDISRIQAGDRKFTMTAFDICEMARQILISFEQRIDEKQLNIEFECDRDNMTVYADRDAIHQVLYNICDNAVKFTNPGGVYRINITAHDKKTYVSVFNEGQGIPEAELPYVFDRFYKSDKSRGLDKTGVGLGLYITKTIMDAHNEEIWVKSVWGEYCEFVFTLQSVVSK
ncbi:MAG: HAMP domain-containing histidine kinase [Ruminococcaceae bacterium]|nr:HAMP domain-containing histidine kinase [Oscillospiraceae bacterium]